MPWGRAACEPAKELIVLVCNEERWRGLGCGSTVVAPPATPHIEQALRLACVCQDGDDAFVTHEVGEFAPKSNHLSHQFQARQVRAARTWLVASPGWIVPVEGGLGHRADMVRFASQDNLPFEFPLVGNQGL